MSWFGMTLAQTTAIGVFIESTWAAQMYVLSFFHAVIANVRYQDVVLSCGTHGHAPNEEKNEENKNSFFSIQMFFQIIQTIKN